MGVYLLILRRIDILAVKIHSPAAAGNRMEKETSARSLSIIS